MLSNLLRRRYLLALPVVLALVAGLPWDCAAQEHDHGKEEKPAAVDHKHDHDAPKDGAHPAKKKEPSAMEHVLDTEIWHLFDTVWPQHIHLPAIPLPFGYEFQITKFMVLEVIAALLVIAVYVPLAQRLKS